MVCVRYCLDGLHNEMRSVGRGNSFSQRALTLDHQKSRALDGFGPITSSAGSITRLPHVLPSPVCTGFGARADHRLAQIGEELLKALGFRWLPFPREDV